MHQRPQVKEFENHCTIKTQKKSGTIYKCQNIGVVCTDKNKEFNMRVLLGTFISDKFIKKIMAKWN